MGLAEARRLFKFNFQRLRRGREAVHPQPTRTIVSSEWKEWFDSHPIFPEPESDLSSRGLAKLRQRREISELVEKSLQEIAPSTQRFQAVGHLEKLLRQGDVAPDELAEIALMYMDFRGRGENAKLSDQSVVYKAVEEVHNLRNIEQPFSL